MNEFTQISGFINAFGSQRGSVLTVKVENDAGWALIEEDFDRAEYGSDPEFVAEVSSFIKRNGGIKDLTMVISR
ncbi:putative inhibitor of transcription and anti-terminator protein [Xanthomonas phage OP1]|uniref:Inhibitor of transcription and anti-terminator protein n=1 Tax=Xanthomonas phage OP1 TaxID=2994040 RepID=Q2NPE5_9CAUD|nr:inhibitor of transcription initiation and antiterminator [Xanthomonas phage OP1]BAE72751.1 putative inhibitor of transcription and anti-terminator protein [Xanthomonas phage OP1]